MPLPVSCCDNCRHRHFFNLAIDERLRIFSSCDTYPNGIPVDISTDKFVEWPVESGQLTPADANCFGIEGVNYLPMREEDWSLIRSRDSFSAVQMEERK